MNFKYSSLFILKLVKSMVTVFNRCVKLHLAYYLNTEQLRKISSKLLKSSNVKQVFMKHKKL